VLLVVVLVIASATQHVNIRFVYSSTISIKQIQEFLNLMLAETMVKLDHHLIVVQLNAAPGIPVHEFLVCWPLRLQIYFSPLSGTDALTAAWSG